MKKLLMALATCAVSAMAASQPVQPPRGDREMEHDAMVQRAMEQRDRDARAMDHHEMDRHDMGRHVAAESHHMHKVWVPTHRDEHGHRVNGHYDWS